MEDGVEVAGVADVDHTGQRGGHDKLIVTVVSSTSTSTSPVLFSRKGIITTWDALETTRTTVAREPDIKHSTTTGVFVILIGISIVRTLCRGVILTVAIAGTTQARYFSTC